VADHHGRLVLYFPVSALVTLFANILQNPQDARARSDLKLMSSVVSFLSMLERDITTESNGNVRRMLSVCAEFDRIAKVVLDKAERDMRSGRSTGSKRKANGNAPLHTQKEQERAIRDRNVIDAAIAAGLEEGKTLEQIQAETQASYRRPVQTPSLRASIAGSATGSGAGASPASWGGSQAGTTVSEYRSPPQQQGLSVNGMDGFNQQLRMQNPAGQWSEQQQTAAVPALSAMGLGGMSTTQPQPRPQGNVSQPQQGLMDGFDPNGSSSFPAIDPSLGGPMMAGDMGINGFDTSPTAGMGMGGSFQQPFVPQDLWQMPMTLEWDWAEGFGLGSFAPGPLGNFDGGGYMGDQAGGQGPQQ